MAVLQVRLGFSGKARDPGRGEVETTPVGLEFWRRLDSRSDLQDSPAAAPHPPDLHRKARAPVHLWQREPGAQSLEDLAVGTRTCHSPPWAPGARHSPSWKSLGLCGRQGCSDPLG